jgi:hypothetical protein
VDVRAQTVAPVFPDRWRRNCKQIRAIRRAKSSTDRSLRKWVRPPIFQCRHPAPVTPGLIPPTIARKLKAKRNKIPANVSDLTRCPAPAVVSPYQKPPADTAGGAFAAAPGTPPVELGLIRQRQKT